MQTHQSQQTNSYRLSIDDNIRFMEDLNLNQNSYTSIFDNPYLRGFQKLHDVYGTKVHFNMFYSYTPDSFSLSDMTDRYKSEFEANSDWMKFSFHSRHNDPPNPYFGVSKEIVLQDFNLVMGELARIVGEKSLSKVTTIHYVEATKATCQALRKSGVEGLMGMFLTDNGNAKLSYYLSPEQADAMQQHSFWKDPETDITFFRNDIVVNNFKKEDLIAELNRIKSAHPQGSYWDVMVHEQYFYPDYIEYHPDFFQKLATVFEWLKACNCHSIMIDDVI